MDDVKLMEKYDKLNRIMRRYFESRFVDLPLTSIQALVLHYIIVESEKRDVFRKDLEEFLDIKGPSVTSLVNNLERDGYLRRESIAGDGRYKKFVLTEKTRRMQADITERVTGYMHNMFAGIPEEELQVFETVILKMTKMPVSHFFNQIDRILYIKQGGYDMTQVSVNREKIQTTENPLGTERVGKLLARYAVPSVISLLINSLYNMVDQIFIGQGVGFLGNGATNIIAPIATIAIAVATLFGDGLAAFFSLHLGKGEADKAAKGVGNAVVSSTAISIALVIFELTPKSWTVSQAAKPA